jgi:sulfoxide reductase heme-binding subunit YedZ
MLRDAARPRPPPDAWLKPGLLIGALMPLVVTAVRVALGTLGANPVAIVLNQLGMLALLFLLASLAATPLKRWLGWTWPMRVRRMLGLLAFFFASLHILTYVLLDRLGEWSTLLADLTKRPFIGVGALAFGLLAPLALTSTRQAQKRMGFKSWQALHRLSYVAATLGVVHFAWGQKKDIREPLVYGAVLLVLFAARLLGRRQSRHAKRE